MKVLVLSSTYPYPLDTGSRNLVYHWTKFLSEKHSVNLLVVSSGPVPVVKEIPGLSRISLEILSAPPGRSPSQRIARFAQSCWKGIPAYSLVVMTEEFVRSVCTTGKAGGFDVVVLAENNVAGYATLLKQTCPVVLFKHSVHLSDAEDDLRRFPGNKFRWKIAKAVVRRFERASCLAADMICTVTEDDSTELRRLYGLRGPIRVVPIGVDLGAFPPRPNDPGGHRIAFYGNLEWGANVDAVVWFVQEVFPRILERHPEAVFSAIGPGGEALRTRASHPRVEFPGRVVPVAAAMQDAAVGIVPVISGTGMRFKLLEMLGMGIPTVTTTLGKLGTKCVHGEHALVADDAESFADAVMLLLSEPEVRNRLSRNAAVLARKHSWEAVAPRILEAVESGAKRASS